MQPKFTKHQSVPQFLKAFKSTFGFPGVTGLVAAAFIILMAFGPLKAQTINIGPNQYAFRYTNNPNYGLFFNATNVQYEFRNGAAAPVMAIDANTGLINTNMEFSATSNILVAPNRYAFRSAANPNYGIYFGVADYEFRNGAANPKLRITASSGNLATDGTITAAGTISASGGNSSQWNAAYGWGNHAGAGYLTSESDPQVGSNSLNMIPRWNGSALITGSISDNGSVVSTIKPTTINAGFNSSNLGNALRIGNTASYYVGIDNNEMQAYSGTTPSLLYLNYWDGDISFGYNTMWLDRSTERIGINTSLPSAKLDVQGETSTTEHLIHAETNYTGSSDIRALDGVSVPNPGYGYGVRGEGGYRGVYGFGNGSSYTGTVAGVYGYATGTAGTRIGVYGYASGGTTNYAGYFLGDVNITGTTFLALQGYEETVPEGYALAVGGKILGEELKIQLTKDWPDYVFSKDYSLMPLDQLETFVNENNHLPGIPSAAEVEANNGFEVGDMQRKTVEKLEELTLYILELKKENQSIKEQNDALVKRVEALEK